MKVLSRIYNALIFLFLYAPIVLLIVLTVLFLIRSELLWYEMLMAI